MPDLNLLNAQQFSSIGNIVTAGLRLYFMRFKPYLRMAIDAHLWLIIPLYGWAKYCAISTFLAQQSFHDLVRSPEEVASFHQQVNKRGWNALITSLLIVMMVISVAILALLLVSFLVGLIIALVPMIFSVSLPKLNSAKSFVEPVGLAIGLGGNLFWLLAASFVYARYFVVELPLAIECNYKPMKALKRCRTLSKRSTFFIFGVIVLVFALTCPLSYVIANIFGFRLLRLVLQALHLDFSTRQFVGYSLLVMLSLLLNAITMPFWQATKAALYYSLLSRREGFDLQFRSLDRS